MRKKLIIYDLDDTVLTGDYKLEKELFTNIYKEQAYLLLDNIPKVKKLIELKKYF